MISSKYEDHFGYVNLLGLRVKDKVSDYEGVVTHVGYDLYGCIQAIVQKPGEGKDGDTNRGIWFDVHRLTVLSSVPVMEPPMFVSAPEGADNYKPTK